MNFPLLYGSPLWKAFKAKNVQVGDIEARILGNIRRLKEQYGLLIHPEEGFLVGISDKNDYSIMEIMRLVNLLNGLESIGLASLSSIPANLDTMSMILSRIMEMHVRKGAICHAFMIMRFPLQTNLKRPIFLVPYSVITELALLSYKLEYPRVLAGQSAMSTIDAVHTLLRFSEGFSK